MKALFHVNRTAYMTSAVKSAELKDPYADAKLIITFVDGTTLEFSEYDDRDLFYDLVAMFELR